MYKQELVGSAIILASSVLVFGICLVRDWRNRKFGAK